MKVIFRLNIIIYCAPNLGKMGTMTLYFMGVKLEFTKIALRQKRHTDYITRNIEH